MKKSEHRKPATGFTLVEVLVALAVVSLVLVALLGSMQSVVASATLIHDRTIASWIASDRVTEIRLGTEYPEAGTSTGEIAMADQEWLYEVAIIETESADIRQIIAKVAAAAEPELILAAATGSIIRPATDGGRVNGTITAAAIPVGQPVAPGVEPAPDTTEGETE
jgi:general secretion pathway protein I